MTVLRRFLARHLRLLLAFLVLGAIALSLPPKTLRPRVILPEHEARVVAFSPDSPLILTDGDSGGCVRDAATGRILAHLTSNEESGPSRVSKITWPQFTPDGRRVVVQLGGPRFDRNVQTVSLAVFDVPTGRELTRFHRVGSNLSFGTSMPPPEYALSADGTTLAFTRTVNDQTWQVTVWDMIAGTTLAHFPGVPPLGMAPDGSVIAYGDDREGGNSLALRTLRADRPTHPHDAGPAARRAMNAGPIAFSPDRKQLAVVTPYGKPLILDASTFSNADSLRKESDASALAGPLMHHWWTSHWFSPKAAWFSRDSRRLFVEDLGGGSITPPTVQVWDLARPAPSPLGKCPAEGAAPEAGRLATAHYDIVSRWDPEARNNTVVKVFDATSPLPSLQYKETGVHVATISPDGKTLALPSLRRESNARSGAPGFFTWVLRLVRVAPSMLFGAQSSVEIREIRFRDASTGRFIEAIPISTGGALPLVEFSPDSKTLIARYYPAKLTLSSVNPMIDGPVELWDVPAGPRRGWLMTPPGALAAVSLIFAGAFFDWRRSRVAAASSRDRPTSGR